ncbi:16309_t:CDS:1, partial [Gigaspora rosea]
FEGTARFQTTFIIRLGILIAEIFYGNKTNVTKIRPNIEKLEIYNLRVLYSGFAIKLASL